MVHPIHYHISVVTFPSRMLKIVADTVKIRTQCLPVDNKDSETLLETET